MTCELNSCIYDFGCQHCRTRFVMSFSCKIVRQRYAEWIQKWGELDEWKVKPNCECEKSCTLERNKNEVLHKLSAGKKSGQRRF